MPIDILQVRNFDTTHERRFFDEVSQALQERYHTEFGQHYLIGNLSIRGNELDAIFIKPDALTILEFKDYGGRIDFHENLDWCADGRLIGGSRNRNPYRQVRDYKFALLGMLKDFLTRPELNLGHISGMVVFHQAATLQQDLPVGVKEWFHIADAHDFVRKLSHITSDKLRFTDRELEQLPVWLGAKRTAAATVASQTAAPSPPADSFERELQVLLEASGYAVRHHAVLPEARVEPRYAEIESVAALNANARLLIENQGIRPYEHQVLAVEALRKGKDVCLATGTASGKTLVFHLAACETLMRHPDSKILAIYPSKALGRQQVERWKSALKQAGIEADVATIDGDVPVKSRAGLLAESRVVVITPDVVHAWLMTNLDDKKVSAFLKQVRLIVLDEVHIYRGRIGSNMAYLLRRLELQLRLRGNANTRLLSASATLTDPQEFLCELTGRREVEIIDQDSAPRHPIHFLFAEPAKSNYIDPVLKLMGQLRDQDGRFRFLSFFDSRNLVSHIAQLSNVVKTGSSKEEEIEIEEEAESESEIIIDEATKDVLKKQYRIELYRAGLNIEEQERIIEDFTDGRIQGLVSTSALEIGIDLPDLNLGVLFGVPPSVSSLRQRIGRIGRKQEGYVIILHDGSIRSSLMFNKGTQAMSAMPVETNHLYLKNPNLQVIQAQCLRKELDFAEQLPEECEQIFSESFIKIYRELVNGQLDDRYDALVLDEGFAPHYKYSLREAEPQYVAHPFEQGQLNDRLIVGKFSMSQLMREAYPGAVFKESLYKSWQVHSVSHRERTIKVKRVKTSKTTRPIFIPKRLNPAINREVHFLYNGTDLKVFVCDLKVSESVSGYREGTMGALGRPINYPVESSACRFKDKFFSRGFSTRGFVIVHEALNRDGVQRNLLGRYLLKNLQTLHPFDSQDIDTGNGRLRIADGSQTWRGIPNESQFLAIFDQGSFLHLSIELADLDLLIQAIDNGLEYYKLTKTQPELLKEVFTAESLEIEGMPFSPETEQAMRELLNAFRQAKEKGGFVYEKLNEGPVLYKCLKPGTKVRLEDGREGGIIDTIEKHGEAFYVILVPAEKNGTSRVESPLDEPLTVLTEEPQYWWFRGDNFYDEEPRQ